MAVDGSCFPQILLDIKMAGENGDDLVADVRRAVGEAVPILMWSDCHNNNASVVSKCIANGADGFILKPMQQEQLESIWQVGWSHWHVQFSGGRW